MYQHFSYVLLYYMYSSPLTVTSSSTFVAVAVLHTSFGASASRSFPYVAVVVSASSEFSSPAVASWVAVSCSIPFMAAAALVDIVSMDYKCF